MVLAKVKSKEDLVRQARIISVFILETRIDDRRALFEAVAQELADQANVYTSGLFHAVAAKS